VTRVRNIHVNSNNREWLNFHVCFLRRVMNLNTLSKQGGNISHNPYLLSFLIGDHRLVIFKDGRVLVHGTKDIAEAKVLYQRYLG
jgi:hypothetical protein